MDPVAEPVARPVIEQGLIWALDDSKIYAIDVKDDNPTYYGPSNVRLGNELNAGAFVNKPPEGDFFLQVSISSRKFVFFQMA